MVITQYTAPTTAPLTFWELKQHLKIDQDQADEENLLIQVLSAATARVEQLTRRQLEQATWDYSLQSWPDVDYIKLPFGNLQSVGSVKWKNTTGTEATLAANTDYLVEINGDQCGRIVLPYNTLWPSGTLYPSNPITIRFTCGYTTVPATAGKVVPSNLKAAILLVAERLWHRGEEDEKYQKIIDYFICGYKLYDEFI